MTTTLPPEEMTAGERLAEVSALLAAGYRRLLAARAESESQPSAGSPQISQTSATNRLGLSGTQSD